MSKAPSMPVFTDALIGDTTHLSIEEFGAYCMILFVTWRNNGQALPDDSVRMARICRVTEKRWTERLRPVLAPFFDLSAGTWRQLRLEKEWLYVEKQRALQSEKGKKSAEAKALKNKDNDSTAVDARLQPDANPQPQPQTEPIGSEGGEDSARAHPITSGVEIIRAFDAERVSAFGAEQARGWPHQSDKIFAERWIAAGADVELCRSVFQAVCKQFATTGRQPPASLNFFDQRIANALADRNRPMPEGKANVHRPVRETVEQATDRRRSALAGAVARRMAAGGTGAGSC